MRNCVAKAVPVECCCASCSKMVDNTSFQGNSKWFISDNRRCVLPRPIVQSKDFRIATIRVCQLPLHKTKTLNISCLPSWFYQSTIHSSPRRHQQWRSQAASTMAIAFRTYTPYEGGGPTQGGCRGRARKHCLQEQLFQRRPWMKRQIMSSRTPRLLLLFCQHLKDFVQLSEIALSDHCSHREWLL